METAPRTVTSLSGNSSLATSDADLVILVPTVSKIPWNWVVMKPVLTAVVPIADLAATFVEMAYSMVTKHKSIVTMVLISTTTETMFTMQVTCILETVKSVPHALMAS